MVFQGGTSGKEPTCQCRSKRCRHDPWVRKIPCMAAHSSILAWRIPLTEELGRLQSMESQRVRHDWSDLAWIINYIINCKINYINTPSVTSPTLRNLMERSILVPEDLCVSMFIKVLLTIVKKKANSISSTDRDGWIDGLDFSFYRILFYILGN